MNLKIVAIFASLILSHHSYAQGKEPFFVVPEGLTLALPQVNVDYWHTPATNFSNNCYNYATNRAEGSWAQPGEASGAKYTALTCDSVYAAAAQDWGLIPTDYYSIAENKDETLLALVVNPGADFHWYRRGTNNIWSHKLNFQVLETDSSGKTIDDPITADRGRYRDFCGYFKVKNYLAYPQQQNAGFVRIGKMTDWPHYFTNSEVPLESKVILQIYSGRQNPTISLKSLLHDPVAAKFLKPLGEIATQANASSRNSHRTTPLSAHVFQPTLGSKSLYIVDSQGIIFPRDSVIEIRNIFIRIAIKGRDPIFLESISADDLYHHLLPSPP